VLLPPPTLHRIQNWRRSGSLLQVCSTSQLKGVGLNKPYMYGTIIVTLVVYPCMYGTIIVTLVVYSCMCCFRYTALDNYTETSALHCMWLFADQCDFTLSTNVLHLALYVAVCRAMCLSAAQEMVRQLGQK
jgi:hypothetical protein